MKTKYMLFLLMGILLMGCQEESEFGTLDTIENIIADDSIPLFEVTNVSFVEITNFKSDVLIRFTSQYNNLTGEQAAAVNEIAVYKDNVFQFVIDDPREDLFIDADESKGTSHCYQFAFVSNFGTLADRQVSRLSTKKCFTVE